jgi:predicted Zn-dependent protease
VLIAALVGDVSGIMAFGVQSARALGDLSYSRDAERAADRDGLTLLRAAGVDPAGMLAFFHTMERLEGSQPAVARYLSTHPASAERLQALSAATAEPGPAPVKLLPGYDWSDVKKICAGRARSAPAREPEAPASR